MVRIHPDSPVRHQGSGISSTSRKRGRSSVGRAPALQAGGRRFEPDWLHHILIWEVRRIGQVEEASGGEFSKAVLVRNQEACGHAASGA